MILKNVYICHMKKIMEKNTVVWVLLIHIAVAVSRCLFVAYGHLDLHYEEAQYWTWSQNLDWSYYSKPPLIAYVNYLAQAVFGHSELTVRLNAILLGLLTAVVMYLFAKEVTHNTKKAVWASMLIYVMPFFHGASMFFSTDALLLFFYLWAMYLAWMAIRYNRWKHWVCLGVALGLGYISKYAMLLFLPSLFLYLLVFDRKMLLNSKLYASLALSILFFMPVLIWDIQHDFLAYKHLSHLSGAKDAPLAWSKRLARIGEYVAGQLAIISPLFLVMYSKAFRRLRCHKSTWFIAMHGLIAFFLFLYVSATRRSGANINWTMFAYVGFPVVLAGYLVDMKKQRVASALSILTISMLILGTNLSCLDSMGMKKILPATEDPNKNITGWNEMADALLKIEKELDTDKVFFFSNSYHITSEILFYIYPQTNVHFVNTGRRMNQFDVWNMETGGINQYANQGYTGIYVSRRCMGHGEPLKEQGPPLPESIKVAFAPNYEYQTHITYLRGEPVCQYYIYVLKDFSSIESQVKGY